MEKIIRYRNSQPVTLDEFIEKVLDFPNCHYCENYEDCLENMGSEVMEGMGEGGCSAFDNSIIGLKNIYLKKYCL